MAEAEGAAAGAAAATTVEAESLLGAAIAATKQTEKDRAEELIKTLTEEALKGTVTFNKNLTVTFNRAIEAIDRKLSAQLAEKPSKTYLWALLAALLLAAAAGPTLINLIA